MADETPDTSDMDATTDHTDAPDTGTEDTATPADLAAEVAKWKEMARKHEEQAKANYTKLTKLERSTMTETERAVAQAREDARAEVLAEANARVVTATVLTEAAGKLADPTDAVALIDMGQFEVDDAGNVDKAAVTRAVAALLKAKPHLAANRAPAPLPGAKGTTNAEGGTVNDWLRRAAGVNS